MFLNLSPGYGRSRIGFLGVVAAYLALSGHSVMAQVPAWGKDQKTTSVGNDNTAVGWGDLQKSIEAARFFCPGVVAAEPKGIDHYGFVLKVQCALAGDFRVSVVTGYGSVVRSRVGVWQD